MAMHTELWFPSVIWSAIIHAVDNSELKRWAYEKQKTDKGRVISNYGGWQSNDIVFGENDQIDKLIAYLNTEVNECARQVGLAEVELYNLWININPPGSYNHLHNHVDSVLSGCYYIDATPEQGNIQFERNDNGEYHIPTHVAQETYYTSTRATYAAKTGALYVFPGWLKHSVQGNFSKSDRLSIAFNYGEKK
jgi:uncharacterized protein (TIGR02466 family)